MIIVATTVFYTDSSHWWLAAVCGTAVNKVLMWNGVQGCSWLGRLQGQVLLWEVWKGWAGRKAGCCSSHCSKKLVFLFIQQEETAFITYMEKAFSCQRRNTLGKTAPFPSHCVWRSPSSLTSQGNLESLFWLSRICHLWCRNTGRQNKLHRSANSKRRREQTETTWSDSRRENLISSQA